MDSRPKIGMLLLLAFLCTATILLLDRFSISPLPELELFARDQRALQGRKAPVHPDLVFIGIEDADYSSFFTHEELANSRAAQMLSGPYPWPRSLWAETIEKLVSSGAKVVAIDLLFLNEGKGDVELKQALERYREHVVLAYGMEKRAQDVATSFFLPHLDVLEPDTSPALGDDRLGYVTFEAGRDGVIRSAKFRLSEATIWRIGSAAPLEVTPEGPGAYSFGGRILQKFGKEELLPAEDEEKPIRFAGEENNKMLNVFPLIPIFELFSPATWENNLKNGEVFKDRIVVIGPASGFMQDQHLTPFGLIDGPEIHLHMVNAALQKEFLREMGPYSTEALIVAGGVAALMCGVFIRSALRRLLCMLALALGYVALTHWVHDSSNLLLPAVSPVLALTTSGLTLFSYQYLFEIMERRRTRRTLERYLSREVAREVLENPAGYLNSLGGVRKPITILFSDVRNFTTITEGADAAQLVKQLNEYFQVMVSIVFKTRGRIDKYIGDAIMADWGSIVSDGIEEDAAHAVYAALEMKEKLHQLNQEWKAKGIREVAIGIGINHGEAIVGNLGAEEKMEISSIGDPVNLASRLEGLTKKYHLDLLVGESVARLVKERFFLRTVDFVQVKGKTLPVDTFTVLGQKTAKDREPPVWLLLYEEGVRLYRQKAFAQASARFEECLQEKQDDYLCGEYLKRCQALVENPPADDWDGVFVHSEK